MQSILTLLSTNWVSSNAGNITPDFLKITDYKSYDFGMGSKTAVIFAQVPINSQQSAGIGSTRKSIKSKVNLDIRVYGKTQDDNFELILAEIIRILDANIVSPFSGWQELRIDGVDFTDLSDKSKGMYRKLIPVTLLNHNVARGSAI